MTLTLTDSQALTLRLILLRIGGDRTHSRRRDADAIAKMLDDAGVEDFPGDGCIAGNGDEGRAAIYFKEETR